MGTPAAIIHKRGDTYSVARVRYDGYISGVGKYLFKFYDDEAKIAALVDKGWIFVIEADPKDVEGHADEEFPRHGLTREEAIKEGILQGHCYLFENGAWYWLSYNEETVDWEKGIFEPTDPQKVTREMIIEENEEAEDFLDGIDIPEPWHVTNARMNADLVERHKDDPNVEVVIGDGFVSVTAGLAPKWQEPLPVDQRAPLGERLREAARLAHLTLSQTEEKAFEAAQEDLSNYMIAQFGYIQHADAAYKRLKPFRRTPVDTYEGLSQIPEDLVFMAIQEKVAKLHIKLMEEKTKAIIKKAEEERDARRAARVERRKARGEA